MDRSYRIGVDIGGTKCAVVLGRTGNSDDLRIVDRLSFATEPLRGPQYALERLEALTADILKKNLVGPSQFGGIGISCGGPLDSSRGVILSPPNLPGWDSVPVVQIFQEKFNVPAHLQNDANAGALAEWRFGAGRGTRNMVFCTFGTGFGAGLIVDGRLYTGTNDMAGEVGHVRLAADGPVGYGKRGSVEGFCSGWGLAQLARKRVIEKWKQGEPVAFCAGMDDLANCSAQTVGEAAGAGDTLAMEIYRESGRYLGQALAILIDILNPEMIVLGSIFVRQYELLWPEAARGIAEEALSRSAAVCRVEPSALGEQIGDYASLAVALYGSEGPGA